MKVSVLCGWNETSTGKLKYLRKNLSQNHCVQKKKNPTQIDLDSKLGCCGYNLSYGMTFEYCTMYTEIQFIPHSKHCMFPLQVTIS